MSAASAFRRGPNAFLRGIDRIYCRWWQRWKGPVHHLPEGPLILVGNHISGVDPLLVQAAVDRPLCFMMAREYYHGMWYARWLFDMVGAIPVNPGGANRHALTEAIEVLRAGNALCLFPEGEAHPAVPLRRILPGALIIARETGAPILPFRVGGLWPFDHRNMWKPFLRRGRAWIRIGDHPVALPRGEDRDAVRAGCRAIGAAIHALRKRRER
ncbi:MAG: lysophospholipid acyltransferase family protein [Mariprofundaceae bacterium]